MLDFVTLVCWFRGGLASKPNWIVFFAVLRNQAEPVRCVSAQALSKARLNLPHGIFLDLDTHLLALV
ncbi:hypothetical protein VSR34_34980 [Paraburkholderia sp. JHI2823]|uniref:hypothetical protein n=1 Tax=Paraburkholderia sp. JHI2823 TaxID=3112960 RepID=UPI0031778BD5